MCLLALCCALAAQPLRLMAATPTPYGEQFVRLGESWPDAGVVKPWPEADPAADAAPGSASFERQLELLEGEGGPYADTLAEPLADLARLHRRNGNLLQAQQAYQRALHVVRINEGLYSENQVPILRELFETYRMTGDMATLDARYEYFFRLYGSGRPPYTPVRLNAALEYLRWQREAVRLELDEQETRRMFDMYSLNEQLLEDVAQDPAVDFQVYRALTLSQLRNLYLLRDRYKPNLETSTAGGSVGIPTAWDEKDTYQHRLESYQRTALSRGRTLLEELIERAAPDQLQERAGVWLELADWNQWNDRGAEAQEAYAQVEKLLEQAGQSDLLQQWLGEPVELPANGAFWQPRTPGDDSAPIVIQARFDVSASGKAQNIEAVALASENESKAGRVRRNLAKTRFRPRIVDGEPQAELHLQRDYQVMK